MSNNELIIIPKIENLISHLLIIKNCNKTAKVVVKNCDKIIKVVVKTCFFFIFIVEYKQSFEKERGI